MPTHPKRPLAMKMRVVIRDFEEWRLIKDTKINFSEPRDARWLKRQLRQAHDCGHVVILYNARDKRNVQR